MFHAIVVSAGRYIAAMENARSRENSMSDNSKLQKLLNKGGRVVIPSGSYWIDTKDPLRPVSKSEITLNGVTLKALKSEPDDGYGYYAVMELKDVEDIFIAGGKIIGDRAKHPRKRNPDWPRRKGDPSSPLGEWGMGLSLKRASRVRIDNLECRLCWGDGIYMHKVKDIRVVNCVCDLNRRQGMSIIGGSNIHVKGGKYINTSGTNPSAGIDVEPDKPTDKLTNIVIERITAYNNRNGLEFALKKAAGAAKNIVVSKCSLRNNDDRSIKSDTFSWWQNFIAKFIDFSTIRIK